MRGMTPVLSRGQMRAFDAHAIEACRVPSLLLMENAGRGAADVAVSELLGGDASGARAVVVCGTGNNGGDGMVIARRLAVHGAKPVVFLAGIAAKLTPDARANCDAWRGIGGDVVEIPEGPTADLAGALSSADLVVDALFGTGLTRAIDGHLADVVRAMGGGAAPVLAVDLPSGLDADTGVVLGVTVRADVTATFAHRKLGLLTPSGARWAGRVVVVDIGVPASLAAQLGPLRHLVGMIEPRDLGAWTSARAPGVHKNAAGHVLVVGGSEGRVGAPQLAARGAMRAGAGLATIATWPAAAASIDGQILEAMTLRIEPGKIGDAIDGAVAGKQAVVVGPGLGVGDDGRAVVERLLAAWHGPLVIDADALTILASRPRVPDRAVWPILTPHPGEAARLAKTTAQAIEADRFDSARGLASSTGAVVVLKGAHTVIAAPDGAMAVSPVACPALATAGSGDVLGGVIAALACSLAPFEAACAGVLLHGLAGEAWARAHGGADRGLLASEIADAIPTMDLRASAAREVPRARR